MKNKLLLLIIFFTADFYCQQQDAWVFFKDKPNKATFLANPLTMLSQKALDRRNTQNVSVDETDVPVEKNYYNSIKSTANITLLGKSKWLNAVHIQGTKTDIEHLKSTFAFIDKIEFADRSLNGNSKKYSAKRKRHHYNKFENSKTDFTYGNTENQITMLKANFLHKEGFTGKDQIIAVIDAGFPNVNTLSAFKRLRDNNQILGGYDFVERSTNFYTGHNHGTNVLSTIGGYLKDEFVGAAPDAFFYLFRTENASVEVPLEETLWVEAAERADSLGVDVINTSLGYTTFDNPKYDYSYNNMDGKTTFITRGAEMAANKGILVVNSAGNEGNKTWKYISAPADAKSVITVGAVDKDKNIASFSSFGSSFDGRIKPEIAAKGAGATIINHTNGSIATSSGTSFSAPIMAGVIACLNQYENLQTKQRNNSFLKEAVYKSANKYVNPTAQMGYGVPNFQEAFALYKSSLSVKDVFFKDLKVVPNPISTNFKVEGIKNDLKDIRIYIFDILGKRVYQQNRVFSKEINISTLKKGIYFFKIEKGTNIKTVKIIKQ
ncbi:S8 family serine peptidase [Polaribacter cellanae]|uniref:S8 family serine peptidase n=1 Tax=Polaribacter cellanae TaxID=2818493 RepID=A0A975CQI2_9FLAO|nr:S8 family serine peptidase [Polaribacter cellanae]QTE23485.1 S8 family serine peptidase [Polaribacter cellanae]